MTMTDTHRPVLEVRNLTTVIDVQNGPVPAVESVSFTLERGKTLGLVGESGCGKSITALSILRLLPPVGKTTNGTILFHGKDILSLPEKEMRMIRGAGIAMIFQDPMSSLNPVFSIGEQLMEVLLHHRHMDRRTARERAADMLGHVGLPDPHRIMHSYPHQLSGGMRQRILIAMSLLCNPDVLIADEPTTAIDVTVQIQILALLRRLKAEMGMAVLLISHDLSVVAEICDSVAVMYAAQIVEQAPVTDLFERPLHPYTVGLLQSIPAHTPPKHRLPEIEGQVPHPLHYPVGCRFAPRCRIASEVCILHKPILQQVEEGHSVACWNWPRTPECYRHWNG